MNVIITKKNRPGSKHGKGAGGNEGGMPGAADSDVDGNLDRLLKLVPAEVITGYTALLSIAGTVDQKAIEYAVPTALLACSVLTCLILRRAGRDHVPPIAPPLIQYVFSVLAFWVWAVALHDPLKSFGYSIPTWIPAFGFVLVPLFGSYLIDLTDGDPEEK